MAVFKRDKVQLALGAVVAAALTVAAAVVSVASAAPHTAPPTAGVVSPSAR